MGVMGQLCNGEAENGLTGTVSVTDTSLHTGSSSLSHDSFFLSIAQLDPITTGMANENERGRRLWTLSEEQFLIEALQELVKDGWKCQNNTFKPGYISVLEKKIQIAFPGIDLRGNPHIESKIKQMKRQYNTLLTMMNTSGFGFSETGNRIEVSDDNVWREFVKKDKTARGMRDKEWPYYNDWGIIFGKDRATGEFAIDLEEMGLEADTATTATTNDGIASDQPEVAEISESSGRKLKRKFVDDTIAQGLDRMANVFHDYMIECGKKLDNIACRMGYEQDVAECRRKVYAELKKMVDLGVDERYEIGSKIASDPLKMDFFFSLDDESERQGWVRRMMNRDLLG